MHVCLFYVYIISACCVFLLVCQHTALWQAPFPRFKRYMLTCIFLYADMLFFILMHVPKYYTCQCTGECMSTCIQNFIMHVKKKVHVNIRKLHVNIQENTCQHAFEISICMSTKSTCHNTKKCMSTCILNRTSMSKKNRINVQPPFLMLVVAPGTEVPQERGGLRGPVHHPGFVGSAAVDCKVGCSDSGRAADGRNRDTTKIFKKLIPHTRQACVTRPGVTAGAQSPSVAWVYELLLLLLSSSSFLFL